MRIWDIPVQKLCRQHLLGEHRELHAIWSILKNNRLGYRNHPETKRWEGRLSALAIRHSEQVKEIERRGYNHHSPLGRIPKDQRTALVGVVDSVDQQYRELRAKRCECKV